MPFAKRSCGVTFVAVLVLFLGGCDIPTGDGPSVNTNTNINAPLVNEKTFSFLGGPESEFEPLVDTTSSEFDSLFVVGDGPKDVSVVQEIDNFDIGGLDDAIEEASGDLNVSDEFEEPLIENSGDVATQRINAAYSEENEPHESDDPRSETASGLQDPDGDDEIVIPFPGPRTETNQILEVPNFGTVNGQGSGAEVDSVRLTDELTSPETGLAANKIDFELTNNGSTSLEGPDDTGTPEVEIQDTDGAVTTLRTADFGETIPPGESATATLDVSQLVIDDDMQYRLLVSGTGGTDTAELTIDLTTWRYQAAWLSNAQNIDISISRQDVEAIGGGASQFEGIEILEGQESTLRIDNQFSFPLEIGSIELTNNPPDFGSISDLNISQSFSFIESGTEATRVIDVGERGISRTLDVSVDASPAESQIKVAADDSLTVGNTATLAIQTMYFFSQGEQLQTSGTVEVSETERQVQFAEGDFVELSNAVVEVNDFRLQPRTGDPTPQVTFDTLKLSYSDVRLPPYNPEDSLEIEFFKRGGERGGALTRDQFKTGPRSFTIPFDQNIRLYPQGNRNEIQFSVQSSLRESGEETILNLNDQIAAQTAADNEQFSIQQIEVSGANPFSVEVTSDANEDGTLNLAEDDEVRTASFDGFDGITDRIDGLELANTSLDFSIETENLASTDAELFAAVQGKSDTESILLTGEQGTNRGVSPDTTFDPAFANGVNDLAPGSLINLDADLEDAGLNEQVQQTNTIDGTNSNVTDFINAFPTEIRIAGQAEVNTDGGDLKLRKPVNLDAGFTLDVPLQIRNEFLIRDTVDTDFSDLRDLTDPDENPNISAAELQFGYTNGLPLGADVRMVVVDEAGATVETFNENFDNDDLRLKPAPKNSEGAADGEASGEFVFNLGDTKEALRDLAEGRKMYLFLRMTQESNDVPARLRADDTMRLNVRLNVETTINTNN